MARLRTNTDQEAGVVGRYLLNQVRRIMGKLPDTWGIVARVPNVHRAWAAKEFFLDRSRLVEKRLKSLASLKTSMVIGCPA